MAVREDTRCGYGSCKPACARRCGNMNAFLANLSLILLFHIGFYSYFVGVMRTMEKRFSLSSAQTGILNSTNDFVQVCVVLFVGYVGQRMNKARLLSCLILFTFVAAFLFAGPFFVFGEKTANSFPIGLNLSTATRQGTPRLCKAGLDQGEPCGTDEEKRQMGQESLIAFIIVAIGCVALGLGGSGNSTLGLSYIDENVQQGNSSVYIGIVTSMYPWGPIVGFLLAAVCTSIPEGLGARLLPRTDPNFIGAWWLGFVVIGLVVLACSIPMFFFPKHMPAYYENEATKLKEKVGDQSSTDADMVGLVKEFPRLFWKLISNKVFWSHSMSQTLGLYVVVGVLIQQPRYLEVHFHQTAAMAGVLAATSGAISGVLGNMAGGIIMRRLQLQPTGMALMVVISGLVACLGTALKLVLPCAPVNMVGFRDPEMHGRLQLEMDCNSNCSCSQSRMEPICVGGSTTYFSACHAGCTVYSNGTFDDCSCIAGGDSVIPGTCEEHCSMLIPYIVGYFFVTLFSLFGRVPSTILTFRIVDSEMRSFAMGFFSFLINLLTFIPGPIIFGMLIDSTCLVWQDTCGKTGNCLFYDSRLLRLVPHGVTLCIQFVGFLLSVLTWWFLKHDRTLTEICHTESVPKDGVAEGEEPTRGGRELEHWDMALQERVTST